MCDKVMDYHLIEFKFSLVFFSWGVYSVIQRSDRRFSNMSLITVSGVGGLWVWMCVSVSVVFGPWGLVTRFRISSESNSSQRRVDLDLAASGLVTRESYDWSVVMGKLYTQVFRTKIWTGCHARALTKWCHIRRAHLSHLGKAHKSNRPASDIQKPDSRQLWDLHKDQEISLVWNSNRVTKPPYCQVVSHVRKKMGNSKISESIITDSPCWTGSHTTHFKSCKYSETNSQGEIYHIALH